MCVAVRWSTEPSYAPPSEFKGAHMSKGSPTRSNNDGSSFSGLFTRAERDQWFMGSACRMADHGRSLTNDPWGIKPQQVTGTPLNVWPS